MEAELLTKIMAGSGGISAVLYFINWRVNRFEKEVKKTADRVETFHREGMEKIEKLVQVQHETNVQIALFNQKFFHGEERMDRTDSELVTIKKSNHSMRNEIQEIKLSIHDIRNKMVTQETLREMVK